MAATNRAERNVDPVSHTQINLLWAATVGTAITEAIVRGSTRVVFTMDDAGGWPGFIGVLLLAVAQQQVLEYYWHRFLHLPTPFRYIHKVHHFYKSPEPFDDMYAHPFEIFGESLCKWIGPRVWAC